MLNKLNLGWTSKSNLLFLAWRLFRCCPRNTSHKAPPFLPSQNTGSFFGCIMVHLQNTDVRGQNGMMVGIKKRVSMVMKGTLAIDFWVDDYLDVSHYFSHLVGYNWLLSRWWDIDSFPGFEGFFGLKGWWLSTWIGLVKGCPWYTQLWLIWKGNSPTQSPMSKNMWSYWPMRLLNWLSKHKCMGCWTATSLLQGLELQHDSWLKIRQILEFKIL